MNKQLETKINILADASNARSEIGRFESAFTSAMKEVGKTPAEIKSIRIMAKEIREGAKSTDDLDQETRDLVTTYNRLRSAAEDRHFLGIEKHEKLQREIAKTEAAYRRLKASGELSGKELSQASAAAKQKIKALRGEMEVTTSKAGGLSSAFGGLKTMFGGFLATLGVRQLIETNREFEKLRASLETVTGSTEQAELAFSAIQEFASKTPYSVKEVTTAFTKLTALGLQPSERSLTSYGNTAAAMGKSLDQMIEAVADATTGEFERLKEFGIKARSEGDKVALTFRGSTTTIGKNASEIESYLVKLGEVEFAGGMDRQAKTLDGAISNLGDAWEKFLDRMLNDEASSGLQTVIRKFAEGLDWIAGTGLKKFQGLFIAGLVSIQNEFTNLSATSNIVWEGIKSVGQGAVNFLKEKMATLIELFATAADKVGADETAASWKKLAESVKPAEGAYEAFVRKSKEIWAAAKKEKDIRDQAAQATIASIEADIAKTASLDQLAKAEKSAEKSAKKTADAYDYLGVKSSASLKKAERQALYSFAQIASSADASGADIVAAFESATSKIGRGDRLKQIKQMLQEAFSAGKVGAGEYRRALESLNQVEGLAATSTGDHVDKLIKLAEAYREGSISAAEYWARSKEVSATQQDAAKSTKQLSSAAKEAASSFSEISNSIGGADTLQKLEDLKDVAKQSFGAGKISAKQYQQALDDIEKKTSEVRRITRSLSVDMKAFAQSQGLAADAAEYYGQVYNKLYREAEYAIKRSGTLAVYTSHLKGIERQAKETAERVASLDKQLATLGSSGLSGVKDMQLRLLELNGTEEEIAQARARREREQLAIELKRAELEAAKQSALGNDSEASALRTEAGYLKQQMALLSKIQAAEVVKRVSENKGTQSGPGKTTTIIFKDPRGQGVSGSFAEKDAGKMLDILAQAGAVSQ